MLKKMSLMFCSLSQMPPKFGKNYLGTLINSSELLVPSMNGIISGSIMIIVIPTRVPLMLLSAGSSGKQDVIWFLEIFHLQLTVLP